jgi:hypothetical protein
MTHWLLRCAVLLLAATLAHGAATWKWTHPDAVHAAWNASAVYLAAAARRPSPQQLYNVADYVYPLLHSAALTGNTAAVSDVAGALLGAAEWLTPVTEYHVSMGGSWSNATFDPAVPMWMDTATVKSDGFPIEIVLDSAQFVYVLSRTLAVIAATPAAARTDTMWRFAAVFGPVAAQDMVLRWVFGPGAFEVHAWGCGNSDYPQNHSTFIATKLARGFGPGPSYCNAVLDVDMWIITSAMELLAAHAADPAVVAFYGDEAARLAGYTAVGYELVNSRTAVSSVGGFAFDVGVWNDHPDYRCAGYEGATLPAAASCTPIKDTTWDVSHGQRFVAVFDTIGRAAANVTGVAVPRNFSALLARQYVDKVWDGNCSAPLFSNYFGNSGWYRVGYDGRAGFGYGLGDDGCGSAMHGGYGLLSPIDSGVARLNQCVWGVLRAAEGTAAAAWRSAHYFAIWSNGVRQPSTWAPGLETALRTLMFAPTMITPVV